jgi:hypothetical protein
MNYPPRSMVPPQDFHVEDIAPGVRLRRLYPGGMAGPNRECYNDLPGGQVWSEAYSLGTDADDFVMCLPEIRMPPNQMFPMHWHDCWTVVVTVEGRCMIGDWYMDTGDVFIAAPSIEYGPLVPGPMGCRILEIFGDISLSPGGYSPEYRDHLTLQGGNHVFKEREGINKRNHGHSMLPVEGTSGMWKTRLEPGWQFILGEDGDPASPALRYTRLEPGEAIPARERGDWWSGQVFAGSAEIAGRTIVRDDVVLAERGALIPGLVAGKDGAEILESFRTTRAF